MKVPSSDRKFTRSQRQARKIGAGGKPVTGLLKLSAVIDRLNEMVGRSLSWLILLVVLISATNAVMRKLFDLSSNSWLELQWYLFSYIFLGCAGYVLLRKEHIRIDIVSGHLSDRANHRIALFGHLFFLLPLCVIMLYLSWPYFMDSYRIHEVSTNAGGLVRWPVKAAMIIGFALLLLQGISEAIKQAGVMLGVYVDPRSAPRTH
jgi:TRAP-type mannitol/chloroaromatic compound transport system permease small subunit